MINRDLKYFFGPMSKNVVDATIATKNKYNFRIGFIPTRRQVEYNGGYVNNWTTDRFSSYVRAKNNSVIIQRDHAGPGQGYIDDDGFDSLAEDTKYMDLIHIDPWKKCPDYTHGLAKTIECMNFCHQRNPHCYFEVGTEEAIRKFTDGDLDKLLTDLKSFLPEKVYSQIAYAVVQSGTALDLGAQKNTGVFDADRLRRMLWVCNKHNVLSKEHNGDYLTIEEMRSRFDLGLNSINIAPELGQLETNVYLGILRNLPRSLFDVLYTICYESKRWIRWANSHLNPLKEKEKVIIICGHYIFSEPAFIKLRAKMSKEFGISESELDNMIVAKIESHILTLGQLL